MNRTYPTYRININKSLYTTLAIVKVDDIKVQDPFCITTEQGSTAEAIQILLAEQFSIPSNIDILDDIYRLSSRLVIFEEIEDGVRIKRKNNQIEIIKDNEIVCKY